MKKEELIPGQIYYHYARYYKWVIVFDHLYYNTIVGNEHYCLNGDVLTHYPTGYSNQDIIELREATDDEKEQLYFYYPYLRSNTNYEIY